MILEVEQTSGGSRALECEQIDCTPLGITDIGGGMWGAVHIPLKRRFCEATWPGKDLAIAALRKLWASLTPRQRREIESSQGSRDIALGVFVERFLSSTAPPTPAPQLTRNKLEAAVVDRLSLAVEMTAMLLALPHHAALREVFRGRLEKALAALGPKPNQATEVAENVAQT